MVYLHTKNLKFGKFWKALEWKILVFKYQGYLEHPFGSYLVYGMVIFLLLFGIFSQYWNIVPSKIWRQPKS
jgi:hypothetical protein